MSDTWPSKKEEIWFQAGVKAEQARIIEVIKTTLACQEDCDHYECGIGWVDILTNAIKGETE